MKKSKPVPKAKPKNKGGRPRKPEPEMHGGDTAAARFAAGMRFAIAGGPNQPDQPAQRGQPRG